MTDLTMSTLADMCETSRDADVPTPLEFAFGLLTDISFEEERTEHIQHEDEDGVNQFNEGWQAGLQCDLDISSMPGNHTDIKSTRAWLAGFIAGQYALANNYRTPYCVIPQHDHDEFGADQG